MVYHYDKEVMQKSFIVAIVLSILDYLSHLFLTNYMETIPYFIGKFIISFYVAYLMYDVYFNFFKFPKKSTQFYVYYSGLFAIIHGLYYRIIDVYQGNPFWSRVNDIVLNGFTFSRESYLESIIGWGLIHGGSFFIGILIAEQIYRRKWF